MINLPCFAYVARNTVDNYKFLEKHFILCVDAEDKTKFITRDEHNLRSTCNRWDVLDIENYETEKRQNPFKNFSFVWEPHRV